MSKKTSQILQYLGTALVVFSLLLHISSDYFEDSLVQKVAENNQLFFWMGLLLWSFGYMKVEADKKKKQ